MLPGKLYLFCVKLVKCKKKITQDRSDIMWAQMHRFDSWPPLPLAESLIHFWGTFKSSTQQDGREKVKIRWKTIPNFLHFPCLKSTPIVWFAFLAVTLKLNNIFGDNSLRGKSRKTATLIIPAITLLLFRIQEYIRNQWRDISQRSHVVWMARKIDELSVFLAFVI